MSGSRSPSRHPLDPAAAHRAAAGFGQLVAAGLLRPSECRAPLLRPTLHDMANERMDR